MSLRAMNSSISGLQSDSVWLDVIGNNISNSNTVGYKTSRTEFADMFSQTLAQAAPDDLGSQMGGVNPVQVGTGTRVVSIQTLFQQGPTLNTGNPLDLSIQGDGFLVVKQGSSTYLTRAGNLSFDSKGNLVDQNGGLVQGFTAATQYVKEPLLSGFPPFFPPEFITHTELKVDNSNSNAITNIQINRDMILPPKATTVVNFRGNLDSFQPPNILNLDPLAGPTLPVGLALSFGPAANVIDPARMTLLPMAGGGFALQQVSDLSNFTPGVFNPPAPLENEIISLGQAKGGAGNYAWEQQPPVPPADQLTETVYDSTGNARQITVQFYQLNDLGTANPPINTPPMSQVCYAWYAFDTTGGQKVSTANLLGGTAIWNGDPVTFDRGNPILSYYGDFIWFNTDGSLAGSGGAGGFGGPPGLASNFMTLPRVYLPPSNLFPSGLAIGSPLPTHGAEILSVDLNFGTFGLLGANGVPLGKRDGIFSDAEGSYQLVNGVNTYVPNNTVYAASQDGYSDGTLQSLSFDNQGMLKGTFSNGQIADLAQVVLAQVSNPEGLSKVGGNYFSNSSNSGQDQMGLAGQGRLGTIQGDSLEGSNVDLTVELSNMIVAQRSFEANARMVSIVNDTLATTTRLGQ
ncbi:MAG TPA: flagellar hook-basal body complex protein [bacterium]|nr:flagellar hook-basal body complex protein [bacterium]